MNLNFLFIFLESLRRQFSSNTISDIFTLNCIVQGSQSVFPVKIERTESVGYLKEQIFAKKPMTFADIEADELELWMVDVPASNLNQISTANGITKLSDATCPLSEVFKAQLKPR